MLVLFSSESEKYMCSSCLKTILLLVIKANFLWIFLLVLFLFFTHVQNWPKVPVISYFIVQWIF